MIFAIIHAFSLVLCPFDAKCQCLGSITDSVAIIGLGVYVVDFQCSGFEK